MALRLLNGKQTQPMLCSVFVVKSPAARASLWSYQLRPEESFGRVDPYSDPGLCRFVMDAFFTGASNPSYPVSGDPWPGRELN